MVLLQLAMLVHDIGIALGLGGATVSAIISRKADKDPEMAPFASRVMPAISRMIWLAIVLLIVSGIAVTPLITWPLNTTLLTAKHILVVLLVLNGIAITRFMGKTMKLAPAPSGTPSPEFLKAKRRGGRAGMVGVLLWYIITIVSVFV